MAALAPGYFVIARCSFSRHARLLPQSAGPSTTTSCSLARNSSALAPSGRYGLAESSRPAVLWVGSTTRVATTLPPVVRKFSARLDAVGGTRLLQPSTHERTPLPATGASIRYVVVSQQRLLKERVGEHEPTRATITVTRATVDRAARANRPQQRALPPPHEVVSL